MATLKDLARSLDLSVMAVSKALRDAPDISVKTKSRVQEEARRINYVPNRAAQNLRSRQTRLLGIVVPQINHTYYANLVWGIEQQAQSMGFQILLGHSMDQGEMEIAEVRKLIARQIEGLLLIPAVRWQDRLATLDLVQQVQLPIVMLDRYPAGAEKFAATSWVVCADQQGAEEATNHLLELGHREILFLAGPQGSSSSAGRYSGYQKAMAASAAGYDDQRVFLAGQNIEAGKTAIAKVLSEGVKFTAVLAFNDGVALGVMEALAQQGLKIPQDVSVVGFGDGLLAAHYRVPLTTMQIPQVDVGSASVRMLVDLIQKKKVVPREFPLHLVIRQSTAALKS